MKKCSLFRQSSTSHIWSDTAAHIQQFIKAMASLSGSAIGSAPILFLLVPDAKQGSSIHHYERMYDDSATQTASWL